jgi:hypothetical protein
MNMTRDELLSLFMAGVERGRDEAIAEDWGNRAAGTAEVVFVETLRYMLIDKTDYKDLERRNEIWDMTNEQIIAEIVGE